MDMNAFLQLGWDLVASEDAGTRQHVITTLGTENGLAIINNLAESMHENLRDDSVVSLFRERTLPLYRIISHPDVLASLILETPVDTIYTFLFGPGGRRGLRVFRFTAIALSEIVLGNAQGDEETSTTAISSSLAVLNRLIEINQSAQVTDGFLAIVETISASIPENCMVPSIQQNLVRIRRRLDIGSTLPLAPTQPTPQNEPYAAFELSQGLPGNLSKNGARHDNDHANIADIKVLPTAQEIASLQQEYLPLNDSTKHHVPGLAGLLDRQFRLLREDTVGQLRDAVREELGRLENLHYGVPKAQQGQQGLRRIIYHNVRFSHVRIDRRMGLQVVADFDQPPQTKNKSARQREDWWKASKLLQVHSLVCFVSSNGKTIFLSVCDPTLPSPGKTPEQAKWSENGPSLFRRAGHSSVLLSLAEYNMNDAMWVSTHIGPSKIRQSLVEFPGVLLPSFLPVLRALQRMSRTLVLPFNEIIAPGPQTSAIAIKPPAYATRRGFSFDLDVLAGVPLTLTPGEPFDFTKLGEGSTLDDAQQLAVIHSLSTGLALVQGPPGCGKSYTGAAIIKALLHNRRKAILGPIICVCYTNHALDQLLEHLVKDGVKQIVRLGSRSKSDLLQNHTLHHVASGVVPTKTEKRDKWQHSRDIADVLQRAEADILPGLNNPNSSTLIQAHLKESNYQHFRELFGAGVDEEGFRTVKGRKFRAVESWVRGAPKKLISNRPIAQLSTISLQEMSASERVDIHKHWIEQGRQQLADHLINSLGFHHASRSALDNCHRELDLRCLLQAHIIGVTTSGLATKIDLLQRVRAKVMICEEAGEVLEAHTLAALLPGVEHAILIGDHEQLRPQINNYELQHDNIRGEKYSLDVSLFERLVKTQTENLRVPLSSLKTQRRMHPSISELVRIPLYPDLQDHPSVSDYPPVDGMRNRLFWLDHRETEDQRTAESVSSSRTNTFEVDMVAALVSHLIRQGIYESEDIAVITPYLGQLQKLQRRLATSFEIVVGDRDQEELKAKGLQDDQNTATAGQVQVQKTSLLNALRVATVDNFQGEEAKVVVVSLVRSNSERRCGFLKTSNRINVLLSRAKHGLYIIGNSETSRPVPMWAEVLSILERSGNLGTSLALCCPRHKETTIEVSVPDDFARFAPEGGCTRRCSSRLLCGHACPNMCHSQSLHHAVRCLERCPRTKKGCEHECPRPCGDRCEVNCQVMVDSMSLPCGHIATEPRCHEAQNPEAIRCEVQLNVTMEHCKHQIQVHCHEMPLSMDYACSARCGAPLSCGHNCIQDCKDCIVRADGSIVENPHGPCATQCGRPYTTCSHDCKETCHGDVPCPPCKEPCAISCNHSKCSKLCHEPCAPCAEDCSWSCPHRGQCQLPCAVPCDILPCSERCSKMLPCGHRCLSICGEVCPDSAYCQICAPAAVKEMVVDFILSSTLEEIDLDENPCIVPPCGHILTVESMDGHMGMSDVYLMDAQGATVGKKNNAEPFSISGLKKCPTCRAPLRSINRYGRIVRRALIDEGTKRFIVWANREFTPLLTRMQELETELRETIGDKQTAVAKLSLNPHLLKLVQLKNTREEQLAQIELVTRVRKQYQAILGLRNDIKKFLQQVDEKEQHFGRIFDLVQDARRHRGIDSDLTSNVDVLQVRNRLLTTVLLIRCDYTILLTFLKDWKDEMGANSSTLQIDLSMNRKDCEELTVECHAKNQPANEVEGHLYWARFVALERSFTEPSQLLDEARRHLQVAHTICDEYKGQTAGMRKEIEDTEKMLRDSTFYMPVSNEEKAAVYAAMALGFSGTGHWYYCENGHPFTIGECGMPMETSRCPQCGSPVGGSNHQAVGGVRRAIDMELEFGRLQI